MSIHFCLHEIPVFDQLLLITLQNPESMSRRMYSRQKHFTRCNCNFVLCINYICYEYRLIFRNKALIGKNQDYRPHHNNDKQTTSSHQ